MTDSDAAAAAAAAAATTQTIRFDSLTMVNAMQDTPHGSPFIYCRRYIALTRKGVVVAALWMQPQDHMANFINRVRAVADGDSHEHEMNVSAAELISPDTLVKMHPFQFTPAVSCPED